VAKALFLPELISERGSQAGLVTKRQTASGGIAPPAAIGVWPGSLSSDPLPYGHDSDLSARRLETNDHGLG